MRTHDHDRRRPTRARWAAAASVLAVLGSILVPATAATAEQTSGTTYYVDSSCEGCEANDGTSEDAPWQSLEQVNAHEFEPGDMILLRSGSSWTGQLAPQGSGTVDQPITVSTYDEGVRPLIAGEGAVDSPVYLHNIEYWTIEGLEVTNASETYSPRRGIAALNDSGGTLNGITIRDNYVHDITSYVNAFFSTNVAIGVISTNPDGLWNDIVIDGNTIERAERIGIYVGPIDETRDSSVYPSARDVPKSTNITITSNELSDIGGDGILNYYTDHTRVAYNTVTDFAQRQGVPRQDDSYANGASVGIWTAVSTDTVIEYNEASGGRSKSDGQGFDADWGADDLIFQYNYSHDNTGFMLFVQDGGFTPRATQDEGVIVRYNVSQNDTVEVGQSVHSLLIFAGNAYRGQRPLQIYNNVFYVGADVERSFVVGFGNGDQLTGDVLFANNIIYNEGSLTYKAEQYNWVNNVFYGNHDASEPDDPGKITDDPGFADVGGATSGLDTLAAYRVADGSVAAGSGLCLDGGASEDAFGTAIPTAGCSRGVDQSALAEADGADIEATLSDSSGLDMARVLGATLSSGDFATNASWTAARMADLADSGVTSVRLDDVVADALGGEISTEAVADIASAAADTGISVRFVVPVDADTKALTSISTAVTTSGLESVSWEIGDVTAAEDGAVAQSSTLSAIVKTVKTCDRDAVIGIGASAITEANATDVSALTRALSASFVATSADAYAAYAAVGGKKAALSVTDWSVDGVDGDSSTLAATIAERLGDYGTDSSVSSAYYALGADSAGSATGLHGEAGLVSVDGHRKPAGNAFLAAAQLAGGVLTAADGAVVSTTATSARILTWNTGDVETTRTVGVSAVPEAAVDVTQYSVDAERGNYTADVAAGLTQGRQSVDEDLALVADYTQETDGAWRQTVTTPAASAAVISVAVSAAETSYRFVGDVSTANVVSTSVLVSASSTDDEDGSSGALLVDGQRDSLVAAVDGTVGSVGWRSEPHDEADTEEYVQLDLGGARDVSAVVLWPRADGVGFPEEVTVEGRTADGDWTVIGTASGLDAAAGQATVPVEDGSYRYIRVTANALGADGDGYRFALAELEVETRGLAGGAAGTETELASWTTSGNVSWTAGEDGGSYALEAGASISQTITGLTAANRYAVTVWVDAGAEVTLSVTGTGGVGHSTSPGLTSSGLVPVTLRFTTGSAGTSATITITAGSTSAAVTDLSMRALETAPATVDASTRQLYDFEGSVEGWTAGEGVSSVASVTDFINRWGTAIPSGTHVLQASFPSEPGSNPKHVFVDIDSLDLPQASSLDFVVNHAGPGAGIDYELVVTLTGADGTTLEQSFSTRNDTWNDISVDLSGWAGRSGLQRIDLTFTRSSDANWAGVLQVDDMTVSL